MMKTYGTGKRGTPCLLAGTAAAVMLIGFGLARGQREQQPEETYEKQRAFGEARVRGGLREAARIKGNYVEAYDYHFHEVPTSVEGLTKKSELVVVGIPLDNRCRLTKDGFIIHTVYDLRVQEVIKGEGVEPGATLKVALPGGKVRFKDGATAEIVTPGFEKMINGRTYALYLNKRPRGDGDLYDKPDIVVYGLTAGPQGLFEIPTDGTKVKSHAEPSTPVAKETKDKDAPAFLAEARDLARRHPRPSKCCQ